MRSGVMVILKIARQHAAQVTLAEDDNVIQTFAADRSDETLGVGILPGDRAAVMTSVMQLRERDAGMQGHTICPGPAADSVVPCPTEAPRSFGRKASLA
jgi:hypothetical protein